MGKLSGRCLLKTQSLVPVLQDSLLINDADGDLLTTICPDMLKGKFHQILAVSPVAVFREDRQPFNVEQVGIGLLYGNKPDLLIPQK